MDFSTMTVPQLRILGAALEHGAQVFEYDGEKYAAMPCEGVGWWMYELVVGSNEYFVTPNTCTCPSPRDPCKHRIMLCSVRSTPKKFKGNRGPR